jgi:integrase
MPHYFPCSTDAVCAAFTRACYMAEINTPDMPDELRLHFHDLRHEGISRLFEMGRSIPQVACVSGHRQWNTLKRYAHLRQTGDKYASWPWLGVVTAGTL